MQQGCLDGNSEPVRGDLHRLGLGGRSALSRMVHAIVDSVHDGMDDNLRGLI